MKLSPTEIPRVAIMGAETSGVVLHIRTFGGAVSAREAVMLPVADAKVGEGPMLGSILDLAKAFRCYNRVVTHRNARMIGDYSSPGDSV